MAFSSAKQFTNYLFETFDFGRASVAAQVFASLQPVASSDNKLANAIVFKLNKNVAVQNLENEVLAII